MNTLPFSELVEINPRVKIEKAKEYPFIEMGIVEPGRRYVRADQNRIFQGGGAKFLAGDTLFARITPCLENGKIAQYQADGGRTGFGSTEFFVFRARPGVSNPGFVYYLAKSDLIRKPAEKSMSGASGRQRADIKSIVDLEVPSPPLPAQRKIATILSAYDDLIENNLRRIKILEEMAQNLYREWFVKFRFPGHQHARFTDSPIGPIPQGWEAMALGELVNTQYGYTESAQEKPVGPKYLRGMDINKKTYIDWDAVPYCPIPANQLHKYQLAEGDIVIIRMADPGKVGIVEKEVDAVFASYLVRLSRKSNRIGPYYLFHFLIDERYQGYITGASTGTTRKSASAGVLTGIDILIPPEPILADFESHVLTFRRLLNNLLERNTTLRSTRDLLLPRLISGEVDVSELDITVPEDASA